MSIMTNSNSDFKVGLVIMASGLGKRFGSNKLMSLLCDKPLIKWVLDSTDGIFDERIVVTRSSLVSNLCSDLNTDCVLHEFPGRNDTVRLGLSAIKDNIDYCFFMQGDQPLISNETIIKMISNAKDNRNKIIRACYGDVYGAPMGFPQSCFNELLSLPEGKGGNYIAKENPDIVQYINVKDEYELWDVDTHMDLERVENVIKYANLLEDTL